MNFNFKALVAAVALGAVASQAFAALPNPTTTTAQSDLIFFAMDQASGNSFVYDLGSPSYVTSLNQNITGAAWTSFLTAENNSLGNVTWGVNYLQGAGATTTVLGTTLTVGDTITAQSNAKFGTARSQFNSFLNSTTLTGTGTSSFNNGSVAAYPVALKNFWGGGTSGWTDDNAVGTSSAFYTDSPSTAAAGGTLVASDLTFNGTTVQAVTVPVPEPETYSMLLGGLLVIGAIARRRKV